MTHKQTRSEKLNLWAFGLILLCLIPFTIFANGADWSWSILGMILLLSGGGFFVWSSRIRERDGR